MSEAVHALFGVFALRRDIPESAIRERFREEFESDLKPNLNTESLSAYCCHLLPGRRWTLGSRWPLLLWSTQDEKYRSLDGPDPESVDSVATSLENEGAFPAADDCTMMVDAEFGLRLYSSGSGAARLYFCEVDGFFVFADHLALLSSARSAPIDPMGIAEIIRFGSNNAFRTPILGISQLPFGHCLLLTPPGRFQIKPFLDLSPRPERGVPAQARVREVAAALEMSVSAIGRPGDAMISGGVDSALIAMTGMRTGSIKNGWFLAMGPSDPEGEWAQKVADAFEFSLNRTDLDHSWSNLEETVRSYAHPSLDFSVLPTLALGESVFANRSCDLLFDGTGGDAWFGFSGLNHARWWRRLSVAQPFLQKPAGRLYLKLISRHGSTAMRFVRVLGRSSSVPHAGLGHMTVNPSYRSMMTLPDESWVSLERDTVSIVDGLVGGASLGSADEMLIADAALVAINQFAAKSGQWRFSRECQTCYPFLMPNVVNLSRKIPSGEKARGSETKWILKEMIAQSPLSREFAFRKKTGFQPPLEKFLMEGSSMARVRECLEEDGEFQTVFEPVAIRIVSKILAGGAPLTIGSRYLLWSVISLKLWMKYLRDGSLHR